MKMATNEFRKMCLYTRKKIMGKLTERGQLKEIIFFFFLLLTDYKAKINKENE